MTNHRWVFALAALGLVCTLTPRSSAQQAPVPTPGVIRINVNLVQVDAVVTDAKGKPVTDLKAEDFEVLQDKKPQKIRNFEFIKVKDTLGSMTVRPGASQPSAGPAAPPPPPPPPKPDQVRRTVALLVDDIALSFDGTVHTRDALKKWVNEEMQPGDLISVVRTNAAMGALQQFTNDKRMLFAAIDRLKFQPGRIGVQSLAPFISGPVEGLTSLEMGVAAGPANTGFDDELRTTYLNGTFNALKYVMQGLRDLPGRKSVILFSEDMAFPDPKSTSLQYRTVEDRLRKLTDEANRSSVVIYAIDPRGVLNTGATVSDNLDRRAPEEIAGMLNQRAEKFIASQDGMVLLAQRTGGLFFGGTNDLSSPLRKSIDDGDGYYLLGYQPEQETFDMKRDEPKYHSISVRVKRPGLKVRSRSGFFGMTDARPAPSAPASPQAQIAKALVSPFTTADLRVRLTTLLSHSDVEGTYIKTLLHFDARDLTFTEGTDGSRSAAVDIAVVTFNENGDPAETVNKTWSLRMPKEKYEEVLKKGLVYSVPVPIKKAGPYQLRVALRDATSQKLGSAMQFIDVPDVKSGRLALSGIVVTAEPQVADDPDGTPAVRIFKSGGAMSYAYEILNARPGGNEKSQLEMQMRLYRDGEIVHDGTPSVLNTANEKDAKRLAVGGRLQLTKVPPGDYVMQVIIRDSLQKSRIAAQTIDFEVRP